MPTRRRSLIPALLLLPSLLGCGKAPEAAEPPVSAAALAAVAADPGVPRERLARAIDALFDDEAAGDTRALARCIATGGPHCYPVKTCDCPEYE